MPTPLLSLLRIFAHGVIVGMLALGQGGEGLLRLLHTLDCECCAGAGESTKKGCCSNRASVPDGPVLTTGARDCACTASPAKPSPSQVCVLDTGRTSSRVGQWLLRMGASFASTQVAWATPPERALGPPGLASSRPDPLVGRTGRFLLRSGGERAALLGCARL